MQAVAFSKMFKVLSSVIFLSSLLWIGESNGDIYGYPEYPCIYPCRCEDRPIDPVCAVNYRTFKNLCYLDLYNRNMASRGVYLRRLYHGPCFEPGHPNYETQYDRPPYEEPFEDEFFDAPGFDDPSDFSYDPSPDNTFVGQPYNMDPATSYVNPNFNADPGNLALPTYSSSYGGAAPPAIVPGMTNNNVSLPVQVSTPPSTVVPSIAPTPAPITTTPAPIAPAPTPAPVLPTIAPVATSPVVPTTNSNASLPVEVSTLPPTVTPIAPSPSPRQDTVIIPLNTTAATTLAPVATNTPSATEMVLPLAANATAAPVNVTPAVISNVTSPVPTNETTISVVVQTTTLVPNVTSSAAAGPVNVTPAPGAPNAVYPHRQQYGPIQA